MGLYDAFIALSDIDVEEVTKKTKKTTKVVKGLKESVDKGSIETIDISGKDMYEKGQAYYYAHTGDKVDYKGKKYEIITDKDGGHKIGYSDTLLLKDVESGEEIEVSKKDFISEATLLKEEVVTESREDYWVLSDGKNPKNSTVYTKVEDLDELIKNLESSKGNGYWELLHYVNGEPKKVWDSKSGKVEESCKVNEEPTYDLGTDFDSRKSFYGKAKVDVKPDGTQVLYSYGTPVCQIKGGKATLLRKGYLGWNSSQTTLRHVKEFLKQNGFKADSMKQMSSDYEVKQANESLQLKESENIDLNDEKEVKKGKEILTKDKEEEVEQIVDVDADTVDKLKDSYIGNTILQCPVCRTLLYKKPDAIVKDEESELYNVGEVCPHCGSEDGYDLVGQVAPLNIPVEEPKQTTGKETDGVDTPDEEPTDADLKAIEAGDNNVGNIASGEEDVDSKGHKLGVKFAPEGKPENESLLIEDVDDEKFDKLVNQYLVSTYNNVDSYKTNKGTLDEDTGSITLEGIIKYTNGKEKPVKFNFIERALTKSGKVKLTGINEDLTSSEKAFTAIGKLEDKCLVFESLAYNYSVKVLEEDKQIRGRVNLKKKNLDK